MNPVFRDSCAGRLLRLISGGKVLPYPEDPGSSPFPHHSISTASTGDPEKICDDVTAENGEQKNTQDNIVTWYGPDDPDNPQNWSRATKAFVTFQICLLTFAVYIGSSMYSPGTTDVMSDLGVSEVVATLGLTAFVFGYALGPMTLAPVAETPTIGRNPVYVGTLLLFVLIQIPTALSTHIAMLVVFRFFGGVLGSPALAIGGASLSEMYTAESRTLAMCLWGMGAVCGPVLGPLIGGYAAQAHGWRWTIWSLMIISGAVLVFLSLFLPETSSKNILARRAARLRCLTGNDRLTTQAEMAFKHVTVGKIAMMCVVRPWVLTFTEPIIFLLNLWVALIFGILFIWFYSIPLVFSGLYRFSLGNSGLAYLGLLIGALISLPAFYTYVMKIQSRQFDEKGMIKKPEMRLPPAMIGGLCIPVCLFWFGWSADKDVHWIVPVIGTSLFSAGVLYILNSVLNYLPDTYPQDIASVMSGNAFIRFAFGGAFPLFAPAMYTRLGIHWATTLLAFLALLFSTIPFLFYVYGERLRKVSKRAKHD